MRPYLVVIKDSFREARASWVLWILLLLVTITLLALAPLGYRRIVTGQLDRGDVVDWFTLLNRVHADGKADATTPAGQIWKTLSSDGKQAIAEFPRSLEDFGPRDNGRFRRVLGELNKLLDSENLYEEAAWAKTSLNGETKELLAERESSELEANKLRRLNRLLVEAAFPRLIKRSQSESIMFVYGPWDMDFGVALPFTEERLEQIVEVTIVALMSFVVGTIGVFVAILATASQVNRIFDEGSINLLLSKPVSRSMLYLAKYVGGCAFITIVAAYFIAGISLIVGVRFGVWQWRPLACLPLFVFMFMTYYSVSGLASIVWKNTIISIAAAIVFFLVCFLLGLAKQGIELAYINTISLVQVVEVEQELVAVNKLGLMQRWDETESTWAPIFQPKNVNQNSAIMNMVLRPRVLGPVIDDKTDRMLAIRLAGGNARNMTAGSPLMFSGQRFDNFAAERGPLVPTGPLGLYENKAGEFLVIGAEGVYRLRGAVDRSQAPVQVFGIEIPFTGTSQPFERISPEEGFSATQPAAAAFDPITGNVAVYSRGTVSTWQPTAEGKYEAGTSRQIVTAEDQSAAIAIGGDTVMVVFEEGEIHLLDGQTLANKYEPQQPLSETPRLAMASPQGDHFAVLYQTGYVYAIDPATGTSRKAPIGGQGDITAATFLTNGELATVDQATRVSSYDLAAGRRTKRWAPPLGILEQTYYYFVEPLYSIFPKPGELDQTARYILTGEKTVAETDLMEMSEQQIKLRPWAPIPSTAIFIVVVLAISCLLMERQEF